MIKELNIVHLYAAEMNIYGDLGNIITLTERLKWRGFGATVINVGVGDSYDLTRADIIFAGGGQDKGQVAVGRDLQKRASHLKEMAGAGVPMLTICGTYQLFGRAFTTTEGTEIPGIGIFKAYTAGSTKRMIGNIVIDSPFGELVGFENHSGQTFLDPGQAALGKISKGFGNNGEDRSEGAVFKNVYGTYLHGPILPKNPKLADHLLQVALKRKYQIDNLGALDDELAHKARKVAAGRPQ